MNSTNLQVIPAPPSLMKSLMAGFDAISKHFELVIFTVCLDLFLWLGPRLSVAGLFESALNQPLVLPESADPEMLVRLRELVGEFNLFIVLRTLPIGIPSLMVSRSPVASPLGEPILLEVPSLGMAFVVWLILIIVGASAGAFYFAGVAQAALVSDVSWQIVIARWPWTSLQTWFLMAFWIFLIFSASMLFGCALTILFLVSGLALEQVTLFALLIFSGVVIWALIPLLFSPHGLFVARNTMWTSIKKSANLTRVTLPTTALLFITILIISEGLRLLWSVPPVTSWLAIVGIVGHAFITTSLLAASFIYYYDADRWLRGRNNNIGQPVP